MILVKRLRTGPLCVNTYIVYDDQLKTGVIIDPGGDVEDITNCLSNLGVTTRTVLLTHGHFDHMGACAELQELGYQVYISKKDYDKTYTEESKANRCRIFHYNTFKANYIIQDADLFVEGLHFKVLYTPGHTGGSICFVIDKYIFSGDTLFKGDIGRTDLNSDSSQEDIENSIKNILYKLDYNYIVYPGHDGETTLENEKYYNTCVKI